MENIQRRPVQRPSAKLKGNPRESEEVRTSKTLSWILRHGAKSEGLKMREDGYVRVKDLVRMRSASLYSLFFFNDFLFAG